MKNTDLKENYRSDYGLLASGNLPYLQYTDQDMAQIVGDNLYPPYNSDPDTLNNMSVGTGATANIRQDIGHSIRHGFGRENGSFFPRSVRRRFNIEFQRGGYNKCKFGCTGDTPGGCGEYAYESYMPESYYPRTFTDSFPYERNFDPYPYHNDGIVEYDKRDVNFLKALGRSVNCVEMGTEMGTPDMGTPDMSTYEMGMKNLFPGEGMSGNGKDETSYTTTGVIIIFLLIVTFLLFRR